MARHTNAKGRSRIDSKHVRLYQWVLATPAYRSLSCYARSLIIELYLRYNGGNNGDVGLSVREAAALLGCNKDTAAKAFRDLQDRGFIRCHDKGAFHLKARHSSTWILTEFSYDGQLPTKNFIKWQPPSDPRKPVPHNRTNGASTSGRVPSNGTEKNSNGLITPDREARNSPVSGPTKPDTVSLPCREKTTAVRNLRAAPSSTYDSEVTSFIAAIYDEAKNCDTKDDLLDVARTRNDQLKDAPIGAVPLSEQFIDRLVDEVWRDAHATEPLQARERAAENPDDEYVIGLCEYDRDDLTIPDFLRRPSRRASQGEAA